MHRRGVSTPPSSTGRRRAPCCAEALEPRRLLSGNVIATPAVANTNATPGPSGYTPAQVLNIYGFNVAASSIGAVGGDGAGQTIAIVEAYNDPTLAADLHAFDQQFGIADPPSLNLFDENGGSAKLSSDPVWSSETSLDVEWAHAVAPMANIVVVQAASADLGDLLTAVNTAREMPDVSVVSMSWGVDEFPTETRFDGIFTTPDGHQSVTFIASSGDTANSGQVQWPATSPNVVSVGGASLAVSITIGGTSGGITYEEVGFTGAVSGVSQYESKPGYQSGTSAGARTTPDVVYDANPTPGFAVYNTSAGGWQTLGGTSSGAPQWAGLVAIANQVRATAGQTSLNGTTQTLPALYDYYISNQEATVVTNMSPTLTAGGLLGKSGKPQATFVITALADAKGGSHLKNSNSSQSVAALLASAPHRKVHPLILNVPVPAPMLHFVAPFSSAHADAQPPSIAIGAIATGAVSIGNVSLSTGGPASNNAAAASLLAQALPEMMASAFPKADPVAELMNAIYGEISALGTNTVVPVGVSASMLIAEPRTTWYIAHVNVSATFGDALSVFINDSAIIPAASISLATTDAPHSHLRAWVLTISILAIDSVMVYYLVARRRRMVDSGLFDPP